MSSLAVMRTKLAGLRRETAGLSPTACSGTDAAQMVALGVEIERLGVMLRTRFARRVAQTGAYEQTGHTSAAAWLAEVSGEPVGRALGVLETAEHLDAAPTVGDAFEKGKLSLVQAKVAAEAGALDPRAQDELVASATGGESFRDLRDRAARVTRRHHGETSLAEKEARAHKGRYLRSWTAPEGGMRLEGWLPTAEGARVRSVLDKEADRVFAAARAAGLHEPPDRYLADALVSVVTGEAGERPVAQVALRVDAGALRCGTVGDGEICEIAGVGPVPVAVAKDLLGDALVRVMVTEGTDVRAVSTATRTIPASLRAALEARDPTCAVPGCTATSHLQIDHTVDFATGGPTELANLARLCKPHHDMKTYRGFRLTGEAGARQWVGPESWADPPAGRDGPAGRDDPAARDGPAGRGGRISSRTGSG